MPGWLPRFLSGHQIERGWRALALLLVLASLLELAACAGLAYVAGFAYLGACTCQPRDPAHAAKDR